ncbi:MAG: hypothetical protein IIZ65_03540, partial [Clostridia bacterium]|nr:hypothetical protein [Clostridia bacterium]
MKKILEVNVDDMGFGGVYSLVLKLVQGLVVGHGCGNGLGGENGVEAHHAFVFKHVGAAALGLLV